MLRGWLNTAELCLHTLNIYSKDWLCTPGLKTDKASSGAPGGAGCQAFFVVSLFAVVTCEDLVAPENGSLMFVRGRVFEGVALYQCDPGHMLIGLSSVFRTCQEDGQWTGTDPTCERKLP